MVRSQFDERCALVLAPAPEGQLTHAHFCRQGAVATCTWGIHSHSSLCASHASLLARIAGAVYLLVYEVAAEALRTDIVYRHSSRLATFPRKAESRVHVAQS